MNEEDVLIEQREELKQQLAAGEYDPAMNIRAGLNFVTSLLLQILAFVLTNLDTVLAFFN